MYLFSKKLFFIIVCALGLAPCYGFAQSDTQFNFGTHVNFGNSKIKSTGGGTAHVNINSGMSWGRLFGGVISLCAGVFAAKHMAKNVTQRDIMLVAGTAFISVFATYLYKKSNDIIVGNNCNVTIPTGVKGGNISFGNNCTIFFKKEVQGNGLYTGNNCKVDIAGNLTGHNIKQGNNSYIWFLKNKEQFNQQ